MSSQKEMIFVPFHALCDSLVSIATKYGLIAPSMKKKTKEKEEKKIVLPKFVAHMKHYTIR